MRLDFSPFSERGEYLRVPDSEQGGVPPSLPGQLLLSAYQECDQAAEVEKCNVTIETRVPFITFNIPQWLSGLNYDIKTFYFSSTRSGF